MLLLSISMLLICWPRKGCEAQLPVESILVSITRLYMDKTFTT